MKEQLIRWEHELDPGLTLRGLHTEPTQKPLIHFLHGNGYCGMVYWPWLRQLTDSFDLFLSDVQGHGHSDVGGKFVGWNHSAELAIRVLDAHRDQWPDQPVYAVGHSFGGVLSILMAAQRPDLFDRLILLDPVIFSRSMIGLMALSDVVGLYQRNSLASRARKRQRHWSSREAAWEYFYERGMFKGWTEDCLWAYIDHALKPEADGSLTLRCPPSREAEIFSSFPRGLWAAIERLRVPTTILYGDRTYPFVPKSAEIATYRNALVTSRRVPGGHCFMQECPEDTARLIRQLLQRAD